MAKREELEKVYKQLSKRVNVRIVELQRRDELGAHLERTLRQSQYVSENKWGELKFSEGVKKLSWNELQKGVSELTKIEQWKSTKIGEIKQFRNKAFQSFKKHSNIKIRDKNGRLRDITQDEYNQLFSSAQYQRLLNSFGSSQVVESTKRALKSGVSFGELNQNIENLVGEINTVRELELSLGYNRR